ncbi:MAG: hypothetical protein IMZ75_13915 [Actinobacteria bacterium]|nr:hypothetical protein [Actinomycetota bacterium]
MTVALDDVVATDGFTRFVAGKATATATLAWSQVSTLAGYTVAPDGTGIVVALTYDLYGIKVAATVTATPAARPVSPVSTVRREGERF